MQVKAPKKYKILNFCHDSQNFKIYALFKKNLFGKNPATRKIQTFCNSDGSICLYDNSLEMFKKYVTLDTWHMTLDMWHLAHDMQHMGGGVWTFSQNWSSPGLMVWDWPCLEGSERKDDLISPSMNLFWRCLENSPSYTGYDGSCPSHNVL